jgi:hypothetical protein
MAWLNDNSRGPASRAAAPAWVEPTDNSPEATRFLAPGPGRIITGAGLAGSQLQQAMRDRASEAPRAASIGMLVRWIRKAFAPRGGA